jgi:hypothetical protein
MHVEASKTTFARRLVACFLVDLMVLSSLPSLAAPMQAQASAAPAEATGQQITLAANGSPLAGADVALVLANMNKVSLGTTDSQGKTSPALDLANAAPGNPALNLANLGKVELHAEVDQCVNGKQQVYLVGPGGQLPPVAANCKRHRLAGTFYWGATTAVVLDTILNTLVAQGPPIPAAGAARPANGTPAQANGNATGTGNGTQTPANGANTTATNGTGGQTGSTATNTSGAGTTGTGTGTSNGTGIQPVTRTTGTAGGTGTTGTGAQPATNATGGGRTIPVPPGGVPLPDEATRALNQAMERYLTDLSQNAAGTKDPSGWSRGLIDKQGLILVREVYLRDLTKYAVTMAETAALPDAELDKLTGQLRKDAEGVYAAYSMYQSASRAFNPLEVGRSMGDQKTGYESLMKEADTADKNGDHAWATSRRELASSTYGAWPWFLQKRQEFYAALDKNPLLGIQIKGSFIDGDYLFKILQTQTEYMASNASLRQLIRDHLNASRDQTNEEIDRAAKLQSLVELWEFGEPKYQREQDQAATLGPFAKGLIDALVAVHAGYDAQKAVDDGLKNLGLTVLVAAVSLVPVVGPFASAGIQLYHDGNDLVIAYVEDVNVQNSAGVLGYTQRIASAEALADAKFRALVAAAMFLPTVPGAVADLRAAGIKVVRRLTPATKAELAREAAAAAAAARAANVVRDATLTAEEFSTLQGIAQRGSREGTGLTQADYDFLRSKLAADPQYFEKLPQRGYVSEVTQAQVGKQNALVGALDIENATNLKNALKAWDTSLANSSQLRQFEQIVKTNGTQEQLKDIVMALKADPQAMRSLKNAPTELREAFNMAEKTLVYDVHDAAVMDYVRTISKDKQGHAAPWSQPGVELRVDDFRTPGGNGVGVNTDRDFRVLYKTSNGEWLEVPKEYWQAYSTEQFAKASGYTPAKLREIAAPEDIAAWEKWDPAKHNGETVEQAMEDKWKELHQQLGTDKGHPEASGEFSDQGIRNGRQAQVAQNIKDVKAGNAMLKDPEGFGMMYNEKADVYLRMKSALHPDGDKLEAMAQLNKGIDMLGDVRSGYTKYFEKFGQKPSFPPVPTRLEEGAKLIKSLGPFNKTITAKQIQDVEDGLRALGYGGPTEAQLRELGYTGPFKPGDAIRGFVKDLDGQFELLKTINPPMNIAAPFRPPSALGGVAANVANQPAPAQAGVGGAAAATPQPTNIIGKNIRPGDYTMLEGIVHETLNAAGQNGSAWKAVRVPGGAVIYTSPDGKSAVRASFSGGGIVLETEPNTAAMPGIGGGLAPPSSTPIPGGTAQSTPPPGDCTAAAEDCAPLQEAYNAAVDAWDAANTALDEAKNKVQETAAAMNTAATALSQARAAAKQPNDPAVAAAQSSLDIARQQDDAAVAAQTVANNALQAATEARQKAQAALEACEQKSKPKCPPPATGAAQTPGGNTVGTTPGGNTAGATPGGATTGGGTTPAPAPGGNVVGMTPGGTPMVCKNSNNDCAELGRLASQAQMAELQAKDALDHVQDMINEANWLHRDAINLHNQADQAIKMSAGYAKDKLDMALSQQYMTEFEALQKAGDAKEQQSQDLRAKANGAQAAYDAAKAAAEAAFKAFHDCLSLPPCPPTATSVTGTGTSTTGGNTTGGAVGGGTSTGGFSDCPAAQSALDEANFLHGEAAKDAAYAQQALMRGDGAAAESYFANSRMLEGAAARQEQLAAYNLQKCHEHPQTATATGTTGTVPSTATTGTTPTPGTATGTTPTPGTGATTPATNGAGTPSAGTATDTPQPTESVSACAAGDPTCAKPSDCKGGSCMTVADMCRAAACAVSNLIQSLYQTMMLSAPIGQKQAAVPSRRSGYTDAAYRGGKAHLLPISADLTMPTLASFALAAPGQGGQGGTPDVSVVSTGNSSGEAFQLQVRDPSGQVKTASLPEGTVLVPTEPGKEKPAASRGTAGMMTQQLSGFCLQFAKLPPAAGMVYKIASPAMQQNFAPLKQVLQAGRTLAEKGKLHPDSEPNAYADSIRQYAVWSKQEGWDQKKFGDEFVDRTKKNAEARNVKWTPVIEQALRNAVPGRWADITQVLNLAQSWGKQQ